MKRIRNGSKKLKSSTLLNAILIIIDVLIIVFILSWYFKFGFSFK